MGEENKVLNDKDIEINSKKTKTKQRSTKSGSGGSKKSKKSRKSMAKQSSILKKPSTLKQAISAVNVQPMEQGAIPESEVVKEPKTILKHGGGARYIPKKSVLKNKEEFMRKCIAQFQICGKIYRKKNLERITAKEVTKIKKKMKKNDTIAGLISLAIMCIYFYEYETFLTETKVNGIVTKKRHQSTDINNILRGVMMALSVVVCFFIIMHYKYKLLQDKKLKLRHDKETLRSAGMLRSLIIELVFNMIICPPTIDGSLTGKQLGGYYDYSFDGICFSLSLMRSYLLLRLYEQYSRWTNEEAIKVCKESDCKPSTGFLIKCELNQRPYTMVLASLFITMILLGLSVRVFEITYLVNGNPNDFYAFFFNAFWFMMVTMTTVGYGDGFPLTHMGRFITLIGCVLGALLMSLMLVSLENTASLSIGELRVFNEMIKLDVKANT